MLRKTVLFAGVTYYFSTKKVYNSPEPQISMMLRGEYQNKIRRFSPPEKIFDVFASIYQKGRVYMTLKDLLKAICFYNYSLSEEIDTQSFNPKFILQFLGKENKFEIYDYFILVRFLAFERSKIVDFFEKNKLENLDEAQFKKFLIQQVCKDYKDYIKKSILIESRQFKPSAQDYENKIGLISSQLFKSNGRSTCTLKQLLKFRRSMLIQLYEFQFLMFPIRDKQIDGVDFARSIVKYIETNKTHKYMKRIKTMQGLQNIKISKEAYIGFHLYMQTNMSQLERVLNEKGAVSLHQFTGLINKFVDPRYRIQEKQLQIITKLLDYDESGFLEKRQILGVLKNLQYYTSVKSGDQTFVETLKADWEIIIEKGKRIKQIIDE